MNAYNNIVQMLAARILRLPAATPVRVGIDGYSASGKTSLGDALEAALRPAGREVLRARLDDFKRPWRERHLYDRESGEGYYRNAYDNALIRADLLEPLSPGGDHRYRFGSINPRTGEPFGNERATATDSAILLADGVFLFRPELNALWDLRIFLTIDHQTSLRRGAARDSAWTASVEEAEALYRTRYIPSEELYTAEVDPLSHADIVIDTTDLGAPHFVRI